MKKRIISMIVILSMLTSAFNMIVTASDSISVLYSEDFNKYETNQTKVDYFTAVSGVDTRIVEKKGLDKALYSKAWGNDINFKFNLSADKSKTVLSFDMMLSGESTSAEITVADKSGRKLILGRIDGSALTFQDGKSYGGIIYGKWTHLDYVFDTSSKYISIYNNGDMLVDRWMYTASSDLSDIKTFDIYVVADENNNPTELYLDNIRLYEGNSPIDNSAFLSSKSNSTVLEYKLTEEIPQIADKPFWNYTMESQPQSTGLQLNDGVIKCIAEPGNENNGVMNIAAPSSSTRNIFVDFYTSYNDWNSVFARSKTLTYETDLKINKLGRTLDILILIAGSGGYQYGVHIGTDGSMSYRGVSLGKISLNEWHKFTICRNFRENKANIYIDKKLVAENVYTDVPAEFVGWRNMTEDTTGGDVDFYLDNFRVYEGFEYREFEINDDGSGSTLENFHPDVETDEMVFEALGAGNIAVMIDNGAIAANGTKTFCDVAPYITDGVTMFPVRAVSEVFEKEVEWDEASQTATIDRRVLMSVGNNVMTVDGKEHSLSRAPEITGDRIFIPLRDLCEIALGKFVHWDDRGFVVISNEEIDLPNDFKVMNIHEDSDIIHRYLFADRPSGEEVIAAIKETLPGNAHPRIFGRPGIADELKQKVNTYAECADMKTSILKTADSTFNMDLLVYTTSSSDLQNSMRTFAETRMVNLALAYLLTDDTRYAERAWKEMEAVCKFPNWFIDSALANAAACLGVAIGYDTFYDYLTDEQKAFIRKAANKNGFMFGLQSFNGEIYQVTQWWRENAYANFNAIANGGLLTLAFVMADEEDCSKTAGLILENCIQSIEYFTTLFYPDGGYYESLTYETYGSTYLYYALSTMYNSTGSVYGLLSPRGIENIASGYLHLQGPVGGAFNFAHGGSGLHSSEAMYWILKYFENKEDMTAFRQLGKSSGKDVYPPIHLYDPSMYLDSTDTPLDSYLQVVGTGGMRSDWDKRSGVYVGIHGGITGIDHDQSDTGSFIFEANGVRWATDLGADSYDLPGFWGPEGSLIYRESPQGNNCFVINPRLGFSGQIEPSISPLIASESKSKGAYMVLDLSECYTDDAYSAKRGFMLSDDRRTLTIRDEIDLKDESEIYWFMHTDSQIATDGKNAVLTTGNKQLKLEVSTNADSFEVSKMKCAPLPNTIGIGGEADDSAKNKVAIKLKGNGKLDLTVKLIPVLGVEHDVIAAKDVPDISQWSIPDGEIISKPTLSELRIDGKTLEGFEPTTYMYTKKLIKDDNIHMMRVEAKSDEGDVEIASGEANYKEDTKIIVRDKNNPSNYSVYTISYELLEEKEFDSNYKILPAFGVSSNCEIDTTIPEYAYDNNPNTTFTLAGIGTAEYIIDLGESTSFDEIAVFPMQNDVRTTTYTIELSDDGKNYYMVFDGQSSGRNNDYDFLNVSGNARFVRYTGYGNSTGTSYSSLADIAVLRRK